MSRTVMPRVQRDDHVVQAAGDPPGPLGHQHRLEAARPVPRHLQPHRADAHFDGAYLRFAGDIEISRYRGSELAETYSDDAIWELMYFGHARDI